MNRFSLSLCISLLCSSLGLAQIRVATSFSLLEDVVKNVGGARVSITNFVPRDSDAHTYQPSTQDVKALSQCKLAFINGLDLESWFEKLLRNAGGTARVITLSAGLKTRRQSAGPEPGASDPHLWWNPLNLVAYTKRIAAALTQLDPAGKTSYASNAERYSRALRATDDWARLELNKIPPAQRRLVTNHDTLGYFAAHYGFEVIGSVIPSFGTESEPSARDTARLIDQIKRLGIRAIFTENTVPPKLAARIAEETGAKIAPALYTDALGKPGSSGSTFLSAFRYNVTTIVRALSLK